MTTPRGLPLLCIVLLPLASLPACSDDGASSTDGSSPKDASVHHEAGADGQPPDGSIPDAPVPDAAPWTCPSYAGAVSLGKTTTAAINETSGLAVSAQNPGVLWLHNDSGDTPRVFAISSAAKLLGEYALQGAKATDWEDMTLGPGPTAGASYLYLADMGDNSAQRAGITIYRVAEPKVSATQSPVKVTLSGVEALPFVYPDGARDAETLLIDPQTGDLYIVAKSAASPAGIYLGKAPQQPQTQRTLTKLGTVSYWATGGDIAADRSEILLRSYLGAHLWRWPKGVTLTAALAVAPCKVKAAPEPQGEAIALDPKTKDYFTLSEGTSQPLYHYVRQ